MKQSSKKDNNNSNSLKLKIDILLEDLNQKLESDDINIRKLFKKIDTNDMGVCTRKEFIKVLNKIDFTERKKDIEAIAD